MDWGGFSASWQFDYVIPLSYFDFQNENDLRLCWNFINIKVENLLDNKNKPTQKNTLAAAKRYFELIYEETKFDTCLKMIEKINQITNKESDLSFAILSVLRKNSSHIQTISSFTSYEFDKLNDGVPLTEILAEIELLKKFG